MEGTGPEMWARFTGKQLDGHDGADVFSPGTLRGSFSADLFIAYAENVTDISDADSRLEGKGLKRDGEIGHPKHQGREDNEGTWLEKTTPQSDRTQIKYIAGKKASSRGREKTREHKNRNRLPGVSVER